MDLVLGRRYARCRTPRRGSLQQLAAKLAKCKHRRVGLRPARRDAAGVHAGPTGGLFLRAERFHAQAPTLWPDPASPRRCAASASCPWPSSRSAASERPGRPPSTRRSRSAAHAVRQARRVANSCVLLSPATAGRYATGCRRAPSPPPRRSCAEPATWWSLRPELAMPGR